MTRTVLRRHVARHLACFLARHLARPSVATRRSRYTGYPMVLIALIGLSGPMPAALAGDASVVGATVQALGDGRFRIDATVRHDDTGWDHYADRWDVLDPDGTVLGTRELAHPHENEQPFTRSLTLSIPADVARVTIRAGDSVHGDEGGQTFDLEVPH